MGLVALGLWLRADSKQPGVLLTRTLGLSEEEAIQIIGAETTACTQSSPDGRWVACVSEASAPVEFIVEGNQVLSLSPAPDGQRFLTTLTKTFPGQRQIRVIFDRLADPDAAPQERDFPRKSRSLLRQR